MFNSFKSIFNAVFKSANKRTTFVEKNEFEIVKNSPWKSINKLPKKFDKSKELFLVRFKNNKYQSYSLNFDAETGTITNHWDETVKISRIASYLVVSLDDENWRTDNVVDVRLKGYLDSDNILVQVGKQYHHAYVQNTGNRYGIALVFATNFKRIHSPKRWILTPRCFDLG